MKLSEIKLFEDHDESDFEDEEINFGEFEPEEDTSNLDLMGNNLTEIPDWVKNEYIGDVKLADNKLSSLKNCPQIVGGTLELSGNEFTNFEYFPKKVSQGVWCKRNNSAVDFKGMPVTDLNKRNFSFDTVTDSQFRECKNFSQLLKSLKNVNLIILSRDEQFEDMIGELLIKKKAGEDLEELIQEGAQWCAMNDYPEDFWGDV